MKPILPLSPVGRSPGQLVMHDAEDVLYRGYPTSLRPAGPEPSERKFGITMDVLVTCCHLGGGCYTMDKRSLFVSAFGGRDASHHGGR